MNSNINNNDDLLVKYLLGEATAAEQQEVRAWLKADAANQKYYDGFKLIWDQSKQLESTTVVDEEAAWSRFTQRVQREEEQPQAKVIPLQRFNWMRAAAILIMLTVGGWFVYYLNSQSSGEMRMVQTGANTLTDTLPDGSVITLNKNSSISYPAKFEGNTRLVKLKGEAFFDVAHDKTKPFIIDADNASIKVVGTSFNVKSTTLKTEVIVETGIVEVAKKQRAIRVIQNQRATVTNDKEAPEMERSTDQLYNYYRTKEFVCDGTPLWKLTDILSEAYDVHITVAGTTARNLPLSTTFHDEPLDDILKVVCATLNLQLERNGKNITLK